MLFQFRIISAITFLLPALSLSCTSQDPASRAPDVAVVRIEAARADHSMRSLGRGFFVSSEGLLVTSLHVVDGAQDITVTRGNGDQFFADFVQGDKEADLAILQVHAKNLPVLKLFTDNIEPGAHVRLLGTGGTTNGVFDRWESLGSALDASVPMLPIDSGSPLIADDGRVIAIAREPAKGNSSETVATPVFRLVKMMPSLEKSLVP